MCKCTRVKTQNKTNIRRQRTNIDTEIHQARSIGAQSRITKERTLPVKEKRLLAISHMPPKNRYSSNVVEPPPEGDFSHHLRSQPRPTFIFPSSVSQISTSPDNYLSVSEPFLITSSVMIWHCDAYFLVEARRAPKLCLECFTLGITVGQNVVDEIGRASCRERV